MTPAEEGGLTIMADGTPVDLAKLRSLSSVSRMSRVREWRSDGERHKATTDELGNTVTEHARPGRTDDRQDVQLHPGTVRITMGHADRADA